MEGRKGNEINPLTSNTSYEGEGGQVENKGLEGKKSFVNISSFYNGHFVFLFLFTMMIVFFVSLKYRFPW